MLEWWGFALYCCLPAGSSFVHHTHHAVFVENVKAYKDAWSLRACVFLCVSGFPWRIALRRRSYCFALLSCSIVHFHFKQIWKKIYKNISFLMTDACSESLESCARCLPVVWKCFLLFKTLTKFLSNAGSYCVKKLLTDLGFWITTIVKKKHAYALPETLLRFLRPDGSEQDYFTGYRWMFEPTTGRHTYLQKVIGPYFFVPLWCWTRTWHKLSKSSLEVGVSFLFGALGSLLSIHPLCSVSSIRASLCPRSFASNAKFFSKQHSCCFLCQPTPVTEALHLPPLMSYNTITKRSE